MQLSWGQPAPSQWGQVGLTLPSSSGSKLNELMRLLRESVGALTLWLSFTSLALVNYAQPWKSIRLRGSGASVRQLMAMRPPERVGERY
jgi:hypothetical protein